MHRVDAELAGGLPVGPIACDVASGSVDDAVDVMWGWMPDGAEYLPRSVVEFVATDTDAKWLVELGCWVMQESGQSVETPRAVRASAGEPTAVVSAPVEDLALWTWTRGGTVAISGQPGSIAAMDAVLTQGMP